MHKKAFTLVELIVVITILAILWTIAFVSFQWFSQDSRDSVRVSDVNLINKSLKLYATREWVYPIPDNSNNITFSWANAWYQWEFWTNTLATIRQMNKVPADPLTGSPYAYSRTASSNEYQLAGVLEWNSSTALNLLIPQANANTQIWYSYMRGTYNQQFLSVRASGLDYILAVPSIIASDILDSTVEAIATARKFAYNGTNNLPSTYSWSLFDITLSDFNYPSSLNDIIVYSWSLADLSSAPNQLVFMTNLQNAYSGSVANNVDDILAVDLSSAVEVNNFVASATNSEIGGLTQIWLKKAVATAPVIVTAEAVDDSGWGWFSYSSISLAANDTLCSAWVTTFSEDTASSETFFTVDSFNPATWDINLYNECNSGNFDYSILCDGVVTDTATVDVFWVC